jgi:transposase
LRGWRLQLGISQNIILIFLAPYSPELNPAKKIGLRFKRNFINRLFNTIAKLEKYMVEQVKALTNEIVQKTCSFDYLFLDNFWSVL